MTEPQGFLCIVLHAHLPYVRHPEMPGALEESWLFEAITECYIPLLDAFERLAERGVPYRLVLSVSPTLAAMLSDPLLQHRYIRYLEESIELAEREIYRTRNVPTFHRLARWYRHLFSARRHAFCRRYRKDLLSPLRRLAGAGHLELWTTAVTHAYLPLLPAAAQQVQIRLGVAAHRRWSGAPPAGFWLPECGYTPALAAALSDSGLRCTVVDSHALLHARPRPRDAVFAPARVAGTGLTVFAREARTADQVWSALTGYPGHPDYREFHCDLGLEDGSVGRPTGIKYYRVTGRPEKAPYDPRAARRRALLHARHFLAGRKALMRAARRHLGQPPLIVAPFDAELFGHWWFEGPAFLEELLCTAGSQDRRLQLTTPTEYAQQYPHVQAVHPSPSSWGEGGYNGVWLDGSNEWLYAPLHAAWSTLERAARAYPDPCGLRRRALEQAARELLLAQGSDWPFLMRAGTSAEYARRRVCEHLRRFHQLIEQGVSGRVDAATLAQWEWQDAFPPHIDWRYFSGSHAAPEGKGLAVAR